MLKIRHLRLRAVTEAATFGTDIPMADGLFLLRAENSSGKSVCIQSIAFALGLDAVFSARHDIPISPAMHSQISTPDGQELDVLEAYVVMTVENGRGEIATIRRWSRHAEIDSNLVSVWTADVLNGESAEQHDYFVRRKGAAQSQAGFHRWLATFVGWELPTITRSDGTDVPLYVEYLAPLFFVEQRGGWSSLQAQTPFFAGIPDAKRRALEFVLDIRRYQRGEQRRSLRQARASVEQAWSDRVGSYNRSVLGAGVLSQGLPDSVVLDWPPTPRPALLVRDGERWVPIGEVLGRLRRMLDDRSVGPTPTSDVDAARVSAEIVELEADLAATAARGTALMSDLQLAGSQHQTLVRRLESLQDDLRRQRDARTLKRLGSTVGTSVLPHDCPTCHQDLPESLIEAIDIPQDVDENIRHLTAQSKVFETMETDARRQISVLREAIESTRRHTNEATRALRASKATLVAPGNAPSEAAVLEKLQLREQVQRYQAAEATLAGITEDLRTLAQEAAELDPFSAHADF